MTAVVVRVAAKGYNSGDLNMFAENRRKFGHLSSRAERSD
jgi:hypothetical protein